MTGRDDDILITMTSMKGVTLATKGTYCDKNIRVIPNLEHYDGTVTITETIGSDIYSILYNLSNLSSANTAETIKSASQYNTKLIPDTGYILDNILITMNGEDITSIAYSTETNTVSIAVVTGNIIITASAIKSTE